ncbi:enoyl-CoA hydratase/isomerase family protein [Solicola sp. PLA-1-18]|uniref:enoyl-CoA hydratase/isomerase family protein n=1 Tax=Solicola sp. PLA-1-18 TaxID=3380532 RepID=UPI003B7CA476
MSDATSPSPLFDTEELAAAGLRAEVEGPVLTVTLTRPEARNAQTPRTWRGLASIGRAVPADVRVVLVRGEGASFSAGLDRAMLTAEGVPGERTFPEVAALDDERLDEQIADYQSGFTWLRSPQFVSVALVQGHAVGGGFQLALACDLRVAAEDAQFCMKESALGIVPDLTGTKALVEIVGYSRALEICATARTIGAAEAQALGITTAVVPLDALESTARELVGALTTPPHQTITALKGLLLGASERDLEQQAAAERRAQADLLRMLASLLG